LNAKFHPFIIGVKKIGEEKQRREVSLFQNSKESIIFIGLLYRREKASHD